VYCWSYAKDWCALQQEVEAAGAVGPIFVSIGNEAKLNKFLELNPCVARDQIFVDDLSMGAYDAVGFGPMDFTSGSLPKDFKLKSPEIGGFGSWMKYFGNMMDLTPVDTKTKNFEGALRLGGTFVVDGDEVIYQWSDRVPGDTPELGEVMKFVTG
jgi:hypothetical protein